MGGKVKARGPGMKRVKQIAASLSKPIKVGTLAKAGTHKSDARSGLSVAEIAFWNEYGTRRPDGSVHIPERPAFREAATELAGKPAQMFIRGQLSQATTAAATTQALERIGLYAQSVVRRHLVDLKDPPNAAVTVLRKGSTNPLVDTGQLVRSISYEVVS